MASDISWKELLERIFGNLKSIDLYLLLGIFTNDNAKSIFACLWEFEALDCFSSIAAKCNYIMWDCLHFFK